MLVSQSCAAVRGSSCSSKHGGWYGRSYCRWKITQEMALWKRTPLYFVRQIFANPCSSSELPSPLWIQKQSNYCHSPYCPPCLQERVAKPRFDAALVRSARRLYCNFIGVLNIISLSFLLFALTPLRWLLFNVAAM